MTAQIKRYRVDIWKAYGDEWRHRRRLELSNREWSEFQRLLAALNTPWAWSLRSGEGKPLPANGQTFMVTCAAIIP